MAKKLTTLHGLSCLIKHARKNTIVFQNVSFVLSYQLFKIRCYQNVFITFFLIDAHKSFHQLLSSFNSSLSKSAIISFHIFDCYLCFCFSSSILVKSLVFVFISSTNFLPKFIFCDLINF